MERLQGGTGMKKKLVGVLLTAAMAVSALAGCGSKRQHLQKARLQKKRQKPSRKRQKKLRLQKGKKS